MSRTRERYATIRQSWWRHPRVTSVSKAARGVYAAGLSYCADAESDGFIPERIAVTMLAEGSKRDVAELVGAEMWSVVDGGYAVTGYLDHNRSKADMQAAREKMAKGGQRGGGSNRSPSATSNLASEEQGTLLHTMHGAIEGDSKVGATDIRYQSSEVRKPPLRVGGEDEDPPRSLADRVARQLDLAPTPGSVVKLLELLSALHCRPDGAPYAEPGMPSSNDRKMLVGVIQRGDMRTIASEWVAMLALVASGDKPDIRNPLAYFAKCFGGLEAARLEANAPFPPAIQEAA